MFFHLFNRAAPSGGNSVFHLGGGGEGTRPTIFRQDNILDDFDIKIDISSKTIVDTIGRPITLLTSRTFILCIFILFSSVGNR